MTDSPVQNLADLARLRGAPEVLPQIKRHVYRHFIKTTLTLRFFFTDQADHFFYLINHFNIISCHCFSTLFSEMGYKVFNS